KAEEAVTLSRSKRDTAEGELATAAQKVSEAEHALAEANRGLDAAVRHHAAAEAAHWTHAGDPCPICERPLPDGFSPPVAEALSQRVTVTRSEHEAADQQRVSAAAAAQTALSERDQVKGSLDAIENRLAAAESAARQRADQIVRLAIGIDNRFRPDTATLTRD